MLDVRPVPALHLPVQLRRQSLPEEEVVNEGFHEVIAPGAFSNQLRTKVPVTFNFGPKIGEAIVTGTPPAYFDTIIERLRERLGEHAEALIQYCIDANGLDFESRTAPINRAEDPYVGDMILNAVYSLIVMIDGKHAAELDDAREGPTCCTEDWAPNQDHSYPPVGEGD